MNYKRFKYSKAMDFGRPHSSIFNVASPIITARPE
jgi:hypothetical protein